MKKIIVASFLFFIQHNSLALYRPAVARSMRPPLQTLVAKSSCQRFSTARSWSPEAHEHLEKIMQQERKSYTAIFALRQKKNEALKSVVMQSARLKEAFDNRELNLFGDGASSCASSKFSDCEYSKGNAYKEIGCLCQWKIQNELEELKKLIFYLERDEVSLEKLRLDNNKIWNLRDELVRSEYKKDSQK